MGQADRAPTDSELTAAVPDGHTPTPVPPTRPTEIRPPKIRPPKASDPGQQPHLRRRLLAFAVLGLFVYGLILSGHSIEWLHAGTRPDLYATKVATFLLILFVAVALWRRPKMPVARMRALEVVLIVLQITFSVMHNQQPKDVSLPMDVREDMVGYDILLWFAPIILYGVLIPNTARRAAVVVGTGMVVGTAAILSGELRWGFPPEQLYKIAFDVVAWLGLAAGFAVFNSARVTAYRQAAAVAEQVGAYRLDHKLGGGGMGEVYLAEHRLLKRPCAVKLIRPEKAGDQSFVRRFEREVRAATRLTHPAAVQVYDFGQTEDGAFYYAMEYLPGLTLDEVVARAGPLPPGRAVYVLRQVCGALEEAHRIGLVHRDIKPSNVILNRLGMRADVAKLVDFGLVIETGTNDTRVTQLGCLLGTPAYMSPEQGRGQEVGPASDLYSLGAVAYFLLTGKPPFSGKTPMDTVIAHASRAVTPPSQLRPEVPADLEAVVLKLLAKDPADRYPDARALDAALATCACADDWAEADASGWWSAVGQVQAVTRE
jgi:serine/threonine-protein kinase